MSDRKSLAKVFIEKYRYASKRGKNVILNEFIDYTESIASSIKVLQANSVLKNIYYVSFNY